MKLQAIKEACRQLGWETVYRNFSGLSEAIQKGTRQQPCPKTGDGKTKFRFFKDFAETGGGYHNDYGPMPDGIEVLTWYTDQSKSEVLDMLTDIVGGDRIQYVNPTQTKPKRREYCSQEEAKRRSELIKKVYSESQPIAGTLAETYLRSRGIKSFTPSDYLCCVGNNLRFHPSLPYREDDNSPWQRFPALLAVVRDKNGKPLTLHRTFLKPDGTGKAPVSRPKMVLAPPRDMRGGFIMLDKPTHMPDGGHFVALTEGIENGLAVREGTGAPVWVGISDRLMAMVNLPSTVRACAVFSDIDTSGAGQRAASDFKANNAAVDVMNYPPRSKEQKVDWNDIYQREGHKGFYVKAQPDVRIPINFDIWWEKY